MRKIEALKDRHEIILNILISLDKFCKKNNINYSIACGTMLGAVRHQGFIPWDDDIDVFMLREEYDKFIDTARKNSYFIDEHYRALIPNESSNYYRAYIVIEDVRTYLCPDKNVKEKYGDGLHIDIFPLDYGYDDYSKNLKLLKHRAKLLNRMRRAIGISHSNKTISKLKKIYNKAFSIIGMDENYWINKNATIPRMPKSKYVANISFYNYPEIFLTEKLEEGYTTLNFEGYDFQSFLNYDYMLKTAYGDYMKLPPEKERVVNLSDAYYL